MINSISSRSRVIKLRSLACPRCHPVTWTERPWAVYNHPSGSRTFDSWQEAMAYARSRPLLMNPNVLPAGYDERHEEDVWRARHGLELL